jgi:hypothetical protein
VCAVRVVVLATSRVLIKAAATAQFSGFWVLPDTAFPLIPAAPFILMHVAVGCRSTRVVAVDVLEEVGFDLLLALLVDALVNFVPR